MHSPEASGPAGASEGYVRTRALDQAVSVAVVQGWRVESRTPTQAVLVRGARPNHLLHAFLTFATCLLWSIVWIVLTVRGGEEREVLTADACGHVQTVRAGGGRSRGGRSS
jgi:hypothetical protein